MKHQSSAASLVVVAIATLLVAACGNTHPVNGTRTSLPAAAAGSSQATAVAGEKPAPAEQNPAGDIPDTQAFVSYASSGGGYSIDTPEGWARTITGSNVQFIDKLNGEAVTLSQAAAAPTVATSRNELVAAVTGAGRAVQVDKVQDLQLPSGKAVLVTYTANSEPDAVTGKQVRLENSAYFYFYSGKLAMVRLWAPQGADNVDQWLRIARSFKWG